MRINCVLDLIRHDGTGESKSCTAAGDRHSDGSVDNPGFLSSSDAHITSLRSHFDSLDGGGYRVLNVCNSDCGSNARPTGTRLADHSRSRIDMGSVSGNHMNVAESLDSPGSTVSD